MSLKKTFNYLFLFFLLAIMPKSLVLAQGKVIKLGVVPHLYGNSDSDDVENAMYNYMGQQNDITHIITPSTKEDFINKLRQLKKHNYKVEKMIIAGHGTSDFPHIKFGNGHLDSGELDKSKFTTKLNTYKNHFIKYKNLLIKDPGNKGIQKKISGIKQQIKLLKKKLDFINSIPAIMENNGEIVLINCSTANSKKGLNFITNLGNALFGDKKGEIKASKSDVTVDQIKSLLDSFFTPGGFWGSSVGDFFVDGDWITMQINDGIKQTQKISSTGTHLETLIIPSNIPGKVTSKTSLKKEKLYTIKATGFFGAWHGRKEGLDAVWGYAKWRWGKNGKEYNQLKIDGRGMSNIAGHSIPYNPSHIYEVQITGQDKPVTLWIKDAQNSYGDNTGEIKVEIFG